MTKLFEFREGYITSKMVTVDMGEILYVLWELYVEAVGISFGKCISCRSCCVYLEYSTLRLYSACLGSNRPPATDSKLAAVAQW